MLPGLRFGPLHSSQGAIRHRPLLRRFYAKHVAKQSGAGCADVEKAARGRGEWLILGPLPVVVLALLLKVTPVPIQNAHDKHTFLFIFDFFALLKMFNLPTCPQSKFWLSRSVFDLCLGLCLGLFLGLLLGLFIDVSNRSLERNICG